MGLLYIFSVCLSIKWTYLRDPDFCFVFRSVQVAEVRVHILPVGVQIAAKHEDTSKNTHKKRGAQKIKKNVCTQVCSPALALAQKERQVKRRILRDGLRDVTLVGHVTDGPLAHPGATQTEDVAKANGNEEGEVMNMTA